MRDEIKFTKEGLETFVLYQSNQAALMCPEYLKEYLGLNEIKKEVHFSEL